MCKNKTPQVKIFERLVSKNSIKVLNPKSCYPLVHVYIPEISKYNLSKNQKYIPPALKFKTRHDVNLFFFDRVKFLGSRMKSHDHVAELAVGCSGLKI